MAEREVTRNYVDLDDLWLPLYRTLLSMEAAAPPDCLYRVEEELGAYPTLEISFEEAGEEVYLAICQEAELSALSHFRIPRLQQAQQKLRRLRSQVLGQHVEEHLTPQERARLVLAIKLRLHQLGDAAPLEMVQRLANLTGQSTERTVLEKPTAPVSTSKRSLQAQKLLKRLNLNVPQEEENLRRELLVHMLRQNLVAATLAENKELEEREVNPLNEQHLYQEQQQCEADQFMREGGEDKSAEFADEQESGDVQCLDAAAIDKLLVSVYRNFRDKSAPAEVLRSLESVMDDDQKNSLEVSIQPTTKADKSLQRRKLYRKKFRMHLYFSTFETIKEENEDSDVGRAWQFGNQLEQKSDDEVEGEQQQQEEDAGEKTVKHLEKKVNQFEQGLDRGGGKLKEEGGKEEVESNGGDFEQQLETEEKEQFEAEGDNESDELSGRNQEKAQQVNSFQQTQVLSLEQGRGEQLEEGEQTEEVEGKEEDQKLVGKWHRLFPGEKHVGLWRLHTKAGWLGESKVVYRLKVLCPSGAAALGIKSDFRERQVAEDTRDDFSQEPDSTPLDPQPPEDSGVDTMAGLAVVGAAVAGLVVFRYWDKIASFF